MLPEQSYPILCSAPPLSASKLKLPVIVSVFPQLHATLIPERLADDRPARSRSLWLRSHFPSLCTHSMNGKSSICPFGQTAINLLGMRYGRLASGSESQSRPGRQG